MQTVHASSWALEKGCPNEPREPSDRSFSGSSPFSRLVERRTDANEDANEDTNEDAKKEQCALVRVEEKEVAPFEGVREHRAVGLGRLELAPRKVGAVAQHYVHCDQRARVNVPLHRQPALLEHGVVLRASEVELVPLGVEQSPVLCVHLSEEQSAIHTI